MRYFKNSRNEIYGIAPDQEFLIREDWSEIPATEATTPSAAQKTIMRINELQSFLRETDYKILPDYDRPDPQLRQQRQAWRNEIRQLNGDI